MIHVLETVENVIKNPRVEMENVMDLRIVPRALEIVENVLNHPLQSTAGTTSVTMERTVIRAEQTARNALRPLKCVATEPVVLERTVERALGIAGRARPQTPIVGI